MENKIICGNWKMHKSMGEALAFMKKVQPHKGVEIIVAAPTLFLPSMYEQKPDFLHLAAQNVFYEPKGAFTGEISPDMIQPYVDWVIIGHSERRLIFHETDELISKKIIVCLKTNLNVIFCVGESLAQREADEAERTVEQQLEEGLQKVKDINKMVIAYEPVWAIGTGKTATLNQINDMHQVIKKWCQKHFKANIRVIYGGSVNPANAKEILSLADVDGCLPGGASLDAKSFQTIINSL